MEMGKEKWFKPVLEDLRDDSVPRRAISSKTLPSLPVNRGLAIVSPYVCPKIRKQERKKDTLFSRKSCTVPNDLVSIYL